MSYAITCRHKMPKLDNIPFPSIFICCSVKEQRQWKECF